MSADLWHSLTGREFLTALMAGKGAAPLGVLLGFRLVHVGDGEVTFEGQPREQHNNPRGITHGGYAAAVLDSALGCAVQTKFGKGVIYSTVELKVNYVRAMTSETGKIRCIGRAVHVGRRLATAEGRLSDVNDKLLAHGSATFMVHDE